MHACRTAHPLAAMHTTSVQISHLFIHLLHYYTVVCRYATAAPIPQEMDQSKESTAAAPEAAAVAEEEEEAKATEIELPSSNTYFKACLAESNKLSADKAVEEAKASGDAAAIEEAEAKAKKV